MTDSRAEADPAPRSAEDTSSASARRTRSGALARGAAGPGVRYGLGVVFLACAWFYAELNSIGLANSVIVVVAAVVGGYMAINIGANDVANNVGPTVGSRALGVGGALLIAMVCEAAGALIAGGDVVSTISKGIIDPALIAGPDQFILAMLAALLAGALWINLATWANAPVSTTHAIVGAVMGAGIAAAGLAAVDWAVMAAIAASWVVSPLMGGAVAAAFLALIEIAIFDKKKRDRPRSARRWVPVLVALMAASFTIYLVMKGLKQVWRPDVIVLVGIGVVVFAGTWLAVRAAVARAVVGIDGRRKSIASLFTIPLIFAAALLSFAHGANDVANAVGPLAAIVGASSAGTVAAKVTIPIWVMIIGAIGIAVGLALYGPRLIHTVGTMITKLDRARAFAIALSAAITVIVASALGLPVSSTHTALGALFGVGFLREVMYAHRRHQRISALAGLRAAEHDAVATGLFTAEDLEVIRQSDAAAKAHIKKKWRRRKLVRRRQLWTIVAAWFVTVPLTALLAGGLFLLLRAVLGA